MGSFTRRLGSALVAGALLATTTSAALAQCEGDCDGNGSVPINELILAVRIALGDAAVADCRAIDTDGSGTASINELVTAVARALQGCGGEINEDALLASARVGVEPIFRIIDLGRAAGGGAAGGLAGASVGRPAGSSGCQLFDCFVFGEFTGSEEVCCFGTEYTLNSSNCVFDDEFGNVITHDGSFTLRSDFAPVCTGVIPTGASFEAIYGGFTSQIEGPNGDFVTSVADFSETFSALAGGCTESQPDQFGFGIRGDGTRLIQGQQRFIAGDGFGNVSIDAESNTDLQIQVASIQQEGTCAVGAQLEGMLTAADFAAGSQLTADFAQFFVGQIPQGNAVFLGLEGSVGTDCIGEVTFTTPDPLRLVPGDPCLSGGRLDAELAGGSVAIAYTPSGGVEFDFGRDGSVDQRFASCQDVVVEECTASQIPGLCEPCTAGGTSCSSGLGCYPCAFNCEAETMRCSLPDDFVTCEDGVF